MKEERLKIILSRLMIWGVVLAAAVMIVGGAIFLAHHGHQPPGDRKFTGEPADLRHPVAIFQAALHGNDESLIQIGVLLLLFNPLVRVAMAGLGYAMARDRLYAGVGGVVLVVLVISYFV